MDNWTCSLMRRNYSNNVDQYRPSIVRAAVNTATDKLISSFPVEALDYGHSLLSAQCHICQRSYHRGDWVRKLPCTHKVYSVMLLCTS